MSSERPEYKDKILFHGAMAPHAYMGNNTNPLIQYVAQNLEQFKVNTIQHYLFHHHSRTFCLHKFPDDMIRS